MSADTILIKKKSLKSPYATPLSVTRVSHLTTRGAKFEIGWHEK